MELTSCVFHASFLSLFFAVLFQHTHQVKLQTSGNDFASRLDAIVSALREDDTPQHLVAKVTIVREGDHGLESRFFWHLIEDSASFNGGTFSYSDFVQFVSSGGQGAPPGSSMNQAPPGPPPATRFQGPPPHTNQGHQGPPPPMNQGPPHPMNQGPPPPMNQGPPPPMNQGPPPPMPPQHMQVSVVYIFCLIP